MLRVLALYLNVDHNVNMMLFNKIIMYYFKSLIILYIFFLVSALDIFAQNNITSNINKNNILIGEQAIITIKAQVPKDSHVEFPDYDSLKTIIPGI